MSIGEHKRCPVCKEWGWFGGTHLNHRCAPAFECRMEWQDDDCWHRTYARDAEHAAEKHAEHYDCEGGEYAIVSRRRSGDDICLVRKPDDPSSIERFAIEAEAVPTYYATKVEPLAHGEHVQEQEPKC